MRTAHAVVVVAAQGSHNAHCIVCTQHSMPLTAVPCACHRYFERNPSILPHMFLMAVCSAVGQLFIFHTIKRFGPLVFATIQTVRQFLSVVLSIVFFAHPLNTMEAVGIAIVFLALGAQIFEKWRGKRNKSKKPSSPQDTTPANEGEHSATEMQTAPEVDNPKASLLRTADRRPSGD